MDNENVISTCFVIYKVSPFWVDPVPAIYLTIPIIDAKVAGRWKIQSFPNVFEARRYIQKHVKRADIVIVQGKRIGGAA